MRKLIIKTTQNQGSQTLQTFPLLDLHDEHQLFRKQQEAINKQLTWIITKQLVLKERDLYNVVRENILMNEGQQLQNISVFGQSFQQFIFESLNHKDLLYNQDNEYQKFINQKPPIGETLTFQHKMSSFIIQCADGIFKEISATFNDVLDSYKKFFAEEYRKESQSKMKRITEMMNQSDKVEVTPPDVKLVQQMLQLKQIEMLEWKNKFEKIQDSSLKLRKNYMREVLQMKFQHSISSIGFQKSKEKNSLQIQKSAIDPSLKLEVAYFNPTDGLDPDICKSFNDYCQQLRDTFESRMMSLSNTNEEITHKLALYTNQKLLTEFTAAEFVQMAFAKGGDPINIWQEIKKNSTDEFLREIANTEFEQVISEITQEAISSTTKKIQKETTEQVINIKNKMQKEINNLRIQLQYKTEDLDFCKLDLLLKVENARTDVYQKQEQRYLLILAKQKEENQMQLNKLEQKLRQEFMNSASSAEKQQFYFAFDKFRMLTVIGKLMKGGTIEPNLIEKMFEQFEHRRERLVKDDLELALTEVEHQSVEISNLKFQIEIRDEREQELKQQVSNYVEQVEQLSSEKSYLEAALTKLEMQLKTAQNEIEVLEETIAGVKFELSHLTKEYEKLEIKNIQLKMQLDSSENFQMNDGSEHRKFSDQDQQLNSTISRRATFVEKKQFSKLFDAKGFAGSRVNEIRSETNKIAGDFLSAQQESKKCDTSDLITYQAGVTQFSREDQFEAQTLAKSCDWIYLQLISDLSNVYCQTDNEQELLMKQTVLLKRSTDFYQNQEVKNMSSGQGFNDFLNTENFDPSENSKIDYLPIKCGSGTLQGHLQPKINTKIYSPRTQVIHSDAPLSMRKRLKAQQLGSIADRYQHKNVDHLALRAKLNTMYTSLSLKKNLNSNIEKNLMLFEEGPLVFKRLYQHSDKTDEFIKRQERKEQVKWFIRLKDSGLIQMTPQLTQLIEQIKLTENLEDQEPSELVVHESSDQEQLIHDFKQSPVTVLKKGSSSIAVANSACQTEPTLSNTRKVKTRKKKMQISIAETFTTSDGPLSPSSLFPLSPTSHNFKIQIQNFDLNNNQPKIPVANTQCPTPNRLSRLGQISQSYQRGTKDARNNMTTAKTNAQFIEEMRQSRAGQIIEVKKKLGMIQNLDLHESVLLD